MLITADWVLPVSSAPIREGAVLMRNGVIEGVGCADVMRERHPNLQLQEFPGCAIMPGLVNAHTHLSLTCLRGLVPPQPFVSWLRQIPVATRALSRDDIAASIALGAAQCTQAGVTLIGEIALGPESVAVAADAGLGGHFFWEALGVPVGELGALLHDLEFPSETRNCTIRQRCGISPHSPYTSGPNLLRATHALAALRGGGFAIHVAESDAETELLRSGTGPLADLATRLADGFVAPEKTTVSYLDDLGVLEDAVLVHCTRLLPVDIPRLKQRARGVVLCPRSNAYLENGAPPIARLARSGLPLGLGTDSLASNTDLDLFEEARALSALVPDLSAERIVRMMTAEGATVLGMEDAFGTFDRGRQADLAVFRLENTDSPYDELLHSAGRHSLEAVLSGGIWRILHGQPTFPVSFVERGSQLAAMKASLALDDLRMP